MNKKAADRVASDMVSAGYGVMLPQQVNGKWVVNATRPNGVAVTISEPLGWEIEAHEQGVSATAPQSGAPLKYAEPTAQVSITVPVSVLAAADAGGRGKRSAWFVAAAREKMQREGAG